MADIRLEGVGHSYDGGQTWALKPMTWTWRTARAYALLGPSGCGKTTLLNIISGLITPTVGRIFFDDRDVTGVPTAGRNIAQVFQFPVLYEEMSVYDNLAFPLRNRKYPKNEIDQRVRQVSQLLGLDHVLRRRSRRLDPGRQQIVSLGRGLVRAQVAALTFADEVVVLNDGAIVQAGEPAELFLSPAHEFVGHFIGSPGMNVLPAEIVGDVVRVGQADVGSVADGLPPGPVRIGVRPEFVEITGARRSPGVAARVTGIDRMGAYDLVHTMVGDHPMIARTAAGASYRPGAVEFLHFPAERTFLFRDEVRCGSLAPLNGRSPG